ncbi:hypothetical protein, partial [Marinobacter salarius]
AEDVTRMVAEKRAKLPQALGTALASAASPGRAVTFEELLAEFETVLKARSPAEAERLIEELVARLPESERPTARDMLSEVYLEVASSRPT